MIDRRGWMTSALVIVQSLLMVICAVAEEPKKIAVLISTEQATEIQKTVVANPGTGFPGGDTLYNSDYWNDLVLTYDTLRKNGFSVKNIYVLYANGIRFRDGELLEDKSDSTTEVPIHSAKYENIRQLLTCLSGACNTSNADANVPMPDPLTEDDFLFLVWIGHGNNTKEGLTTACDSPCGGPHPAEGYTFFNTFDQNNVVCDCELPSWLSNMVFRRRAFLFATCRAGGVIQELRGINSVVMTSCPASGFDNSAYPGVDEEGYLVAHRKWVYLVDSSLQQLAEPWVSVDGDSNHNNLLSLSEAHVRGVSQLDPTEYQPVLDDIGDRAPCTHLRLVEPSRDAEIFSKDHPSDWSNEPSTVPGVAWWESPDLWVRNECSCLDTRHQEPLVGKTNYICARYHNIGCNAADAAIELKWVEPSTWEGWLFVNNINSTSIHIPSASSVVTNPVEWSAAPLPGTYSLLAVADLPGDVHESLDEVNENNVVRVALSNRTIAPESEGLWTFVLENPSVERIENVDIEFDLSQLPPDAKLILEVPGSIGAEIPRSCSGDTHDGWQQIDLSCIATKPQIRNIPLEPEERRRALLTLQLGESGLEKTTRVRMTQSASSKVVGGITFQATPTSVEEFACRSLHNFVGVLRSFPRENDARREGPLFAQVDLSDLPCNADELHDQYLAVFGEFVRSYRDVFSGYSKADTMFSRKLNAAAEALVASTRTEFGPSRSKRRSALTGFSATRTELTEYSVQAYKISLFLWLALQENRTSK